MLIVISVLRLEYMNLGWEKSYCIILPVYCIILPRARGKMIQLTTHFEWFVSSTNATLCLFFFLSSCNQYLTVHYTFKSNKIYQIIKAGKKYFKKVDHFAPVSPTGANLKAHSTHVKHRLAWNHISYASISWLIKEMFINNILFNSCTLTYILFLPTN